MRLLPCYLFTIPLSNNCLLLGFTLICASINLDYKGSDCAIQTLSVALIIQNPTVNSKYYTVPNCVMKSVTEMANKNNRHE